MLDIRRGFSIDDRLFAWGTTADEAADVLSTRRDEEPGSRWRRMEVACGPTYGLDTIGAELTAHGGDRPITDLKYELAAIPGEARPDPDRWVIPLTHALGEPVEAEHHVVPKSGDASGSVRFYAGWRAGEQTVGLSLYGSPRGTEHGSAAGCLWLSWATEPAARPFVDEWRKRSEALAVAADSHSGFVTFKPHQAQTGANGSAGRGRKSASHDSTYALHTPQLPPTPPAIGQKLGKRGFGFWRSDDGNRWFASNQWDTIAFAMGSAVEIDAYDVQPAKGGGYAEIMIDGWRVRDDHGSDAIADAVAALRTIDGVSIRVIDGYDC